MTNRIEGFIGCPDHGALFRLEAEEQRPGVYSHVKVPLDGVTAAAGAKHCPAEGCGKTLERVPAPK